MAGEKIQVLVKDIYFTDPMETEAKKLGGAMVEKEPSAQAALFSFPNKENAHNFIFIAHQRGYQAHLQELGPSGWDTPLDALRQDAERIRRALKKPPLRPPWAQ